MSGQTRKDTVSNLFSAYIRELKLYQKSPHTISGYETSFKMFCRFMDVQKLPIGVIKKETVLDYTEKLLNGDYAVSSINHYLRDLRAFLYWCMENNYIVPFKVKLLKDTTPLKRPYSKEEVKVLLRKPFPDDGFSEWRTWAIINMVIGCGVRSSTISNMLKQDIDYENNSIYLRHSKDGKNSNSIALVPQLKKAIVSYLKYNPNDTDYLFPSITGEQLSPHSIGLSLVRYNKKRGVEQTSLHLLRHTFGALWAENGGDVYELQRIMTHKDIRTTQNYINMYSDKASDTRVIRFNPLENINK
jgi:integrase/recombinase XerD